MLLLMMVMTTMLSRLNLTDGCGDLLSFNTPWFSFFFPI
jgi:hypothetical protein